MNVSNLSLSLCLFMRIIFFLISIACFKYPYTTLGFSNISVENMDDYPFGFGMNATVICDQGFRVSFRESRQYSMCTEKGWNTSKLQPCYEGR